MDSLHPPLSSFPIALVLTAAGLELLGLVWRKDFLRHAVSVNLVAAALGIVAAFLSGYGASDTAQKTFIISDDVIEAHHEVGVLLLIVVFPCVAMHFVRTIALRAKLLWHAAFYLLLAATVVLTVVAGYRGGKLVFEHGAGVSATPPSGSGT